MDDAIHQTEMHKVWEHHINSLMEEVEKQQGNDNTKDYILTTLYNLLYYQKTNEIIDSAETFLDDFHAGFSINSLNSQYHRQQLPAILPDTRLREVWKDIAAELAPYPYPPFEIAWRGKVRELMKQTANSSLNPDAKKLILGCLPIFFKRALTTHNAFESEVTFLRIYDNIIKAFIPLTHGSHSASILS